jgi:hypothetical protein
MMNASQYYGGSREEAIAGKESYRLRMAAQEYGYTVRREKGKVVIVIMPAARREARNDERRITNNYGDGYGYGYGYGD